MATAVEGARAAVRTAAVPAGGGEALAGRMLWRLRLTGSMANGVGAVLTFILLAVVDAGDDVPRQRGGELLGLFLVATAIGLGLAAMILERRFRPIVRALREERPLVGDVRRLLFTTPLANAVVSVAFWALAGIIFGLHAYVRLDNGGRESLTLGIILLMSGFTTGAAVYLLLDAGLRPAFALAFEHQEPEGPRGVAVRPRLILVWLLGSGIPLIVTVLLILDPESDASDIRYAATPWAVLGLVVGFALTARAARSLADPLTQLRRGMGDVRRGNLDTRATVDDAGEVGVLQAGFNAMVSGLEERERLRELFGRHVGEEVARAALQRGVALGGEQVEASALFVDLVGSTEMAGRLAPAAVVEVLNDFFAVVVRAVDAEGGWVNKFEGDAALCVFGPPAGDTDHTARALRAARLMHQGVRRFAARHPDLDAGIGVSSGPVVAGNVGSEQRYEYTVIGDPVNEAARLTELAKDRPGRVVASGRAVAAADDAEASCWRPAGEAVLRGRHEPTDLYEPSA